MSLGNLTHCGVPAPYLPLPPGEGGGEGVSESAVLCFTRTFNLSNSA
jgi:hypothetical protein